MGNDKCHPKGPEVKYWIILEEGDKGFDPKINDNKPYYYNAKYNDIWRRNIMGWGPPCIE